MGFWYVSIIDESDFLEVSLFIPGGPPSEAFIQYVFENPFSNERMSCSIETTSFNDFFHKIIEQRGSLSVHQTLLFKWNVLERLSFLKCFAVFSLKIPPPQKKKHVQRE